jgi:3-oxoacyl-[acyl-carrier-protein] synthase I
MKHSYFLGAGLHTALGAGVTRNIDALFEPLPTPEQYTITAAEEPVAAPALLLADRPLVDIEGRFWEVAETVVGDAIQSAGLSPADVRDAALVLGTSSLDIPVSEAIYQRELAEGADAHPLTSNSTMGRLAQRLRQVHGIRGPDYTICTACTASANALIYADALVKSGRVRHAVVVGVEMFNIITALGFQSLELLAPKGMKPFDSARAGLTLGESCAALVIGAEKREANAFHLRGSANLCDIFGISAANPDGSTVAEVIRMALANAKLTPADINGVKAHGTASLLNDEAEAAGMRLVFDALPPVCALKPFIGHTFGACGVTELILFCGLAARGYFPATPGVCAEPSDLDIRLPQSPQPLAPGIFQLNYFGFGGNNTSLVIANVAA